MATLRIATGVTFLNRNEIVLLLCLKRPQKLLIILSIKSEGQPVTCRALHDTVSPSLPRLLPRSLRPPHRLPCRSFRFTAAEDLVFCPRASRPPRMHSVCPDVLFPKTGIFSDRARKVARLSPARRLLSVPHTLLLFCDTFRHMSAVIFLFIDCLPLLGRRFQER